MERQSHSNYSSFLELSVLAVTEYDDRWRRRHPTADAGKRLRRAIATMKSHSLGEKNFMPFFCLSRTAETQQAQRFAVKAGQLGLRQKKKKKQT